MDNPNSGRPGGLSPFSSSPSVSPVPASIPDAFEILIDPDEYRRRRADEIESALSSYRFHRSWTAYAAYLLNDMARGQRDPRQQWGSLHHQVAILAAGLRAEAQGMETREGGNAVPSRSDDSPVGNADAPQGGSHEQG